MGVSTGSAATLMKQIAVENVKLDLLVEIYYFWQKHIRLAAFKEKNRPRLAG